MDKLVNYEKLSEFKDNLLNDSVASPKATWSSKKITTYLNTELANYATTASVDASLATKADVYEVASLEEIESLFIPVPTGPAANEIWYITSNESVITPYAAEALPTIVSNVYENGKGVIKFASNLTTIGLNAFAQNNTNLTSITLPEGLTTLGVGCFYGCKNLTSITIPESVTLIDNSAFQNGFRAQYFHLTIPENVLTIGEWAFSSCLGIKTLTIGSSVTSIGTRAFSNLSYLETINFTGTMAQWNAITKGSKWITGVGSQLQTPPSVVHCSDGDVNL